MSLINGSPKKIQPKNSYFLRCYGFSINQEKLSSDKVKRKQSSCFSFKIFQRKQSPAKTVPIDTATAATAAAAVKVGAEKLNTSGDIHVVVKLEKKVSVKRQQLPTATTVNVPDQVPVTGQTIHFNRFNKTKYDKHKDIILGNSKKLDHDLQHWSCQNGLIRSFTIANNDNGSNLVIGSPQDKHEISRTVSLPPPMLNKQPTPTYRDKVDEETDTTFNKGNFDSVIGMSILMVTLIIMLFWGKFCAIVCTSAWFYFLPRFRAKNELVINGGNLDVNSKEYKKKVVLNGFLERNHRNYVGS